MKKMIYFVISIFLFMQPVIAETSVIKGGVVYTAETAKQKAFEGIDLKLDKNIVEPYLYDDNNKDNRYALKANKQIKGRYLMSFSLAKGLVNGYVVVYDDKPQYAYYYSTSGYLVGIDIDTKSQDGVFPYKVGKYNPITRNLIAIGLYVSEDEQFAYTKGGKLKAHWIGDTGYNTKGKVIGKRTVLDDPFSEPVFDNNN